MLSIGQTMTNLSKVGICPVRQVSGRCITYFMSASANYTCMDNETPELHTKTWEGLS